MKGTNWVKNGVRHVIGRRRRSPLIKSIHKAVMFVDSAYRNEGADFFSNGEWDVLRSLEHAGFGVAFDVGANVGDWTYQALACWPDAEVHAFEVVPETSRRLIDRCNTLPNRQRLTINDIGLSDEVSTQKMFYFPAHPELTCDVPRHANYESVEFDAHLTTGDEYCDTKAIDTIDFLKIDVEGAEHRVLKGFGRRLRAQKIHCIQFEYGAFSTQTRVLLADYYAQLSDYYWIGKIYPGYVEFVDYVWEMEDFRFCNYLCVSRKRPDLKKVL